jgi:hypothetical protein
MSNTDLHSQTPALWGKPRATLLPLGATYMAIAAADAPRGLDSTVPSRNAANLYCVF